MISWTIETLWVKPQEDDHTDVVVTAGWRCNGEDETYTATVYGTASFTLESTDPFTPYEDLTQEQVLDWCWANGVDKTAVETSVAEQIENQKNPPIITPPLPWNQPPA